MFLTIRRAGAIGVFVLATTSVVPRLISAGASAANGDPPSEAPDPSSSLGHWYNHNTRNFAHKIKFSKYTEIDVPSSTNPPGMCRIRIAAADSAHNILPNAVVNKWYPAALITNVSIGNSNCHASLFDLDTGEQLLWLAQIQVTTLPGSPQAAIGVGQVARLGKNIWDADTPFGGSYSPRLLSRCDHKSDPDQPDNAQVYYKVTDVCQYFLDKKHDAAAIVQDFQKLLSEKSASGSLSPRDSPLILWFACGGDCCYAEL